MAYGATLTVDRHDMIRATVTFANTSGTATDPDTITWTLRAPSGVETDYVYGTDSEVTRSSAGVYVLAVALDQSGQWDVRARGTGAVEQTVIGKVVVDRDRFTS